MGDAPLSLDYASAMHLRAALPFVLLGLLAIGCDKPKPRLGAPCEKGARVCSGSSLMVCPKDAWQADTCKGPKGCHEEKGIPTCDTTGDVAGDPCPLAYEGLSGCSTDGKRRLTCKAGTYSVEACEGSDGCTLEQFGSATCDPGPPREGEPCSGDPRIQRCDADGKGLLLCGSAAKFVVAQKCPGPTGCTDAGGGLVHCDPNGAFVAGDGCVLLSTTCSADGATQLRCEGGAFAAHDCPGPERCSRGGTDCDLGFAKLGDPCEPGKRACSDDRSALLECKAGKPAKGLEEAPEPTLAVKKKCKGECSPKDGELRCD